jgi:hypothetical protein
MQKDVYVSKGINNIPDGENSSGLSKPPLEAVIHHK